jgi:cation transport protein ChaC
VNKPMSVTKSMSVPYPTHLKPVEFSDDVRRAHMADILSKNPNKNPKGADIRGSDIRGADIWIFGYGSLMWDPRFEPAETRIATLENHRRSFCFWTTRGRGSPERPGLGLGIEPGGGPIKGLAYRLARDHTLDDVLEALWLREMSSGVYHAPWLTLETEDGPVSAITYVANREHGNYAGDLPLDDRAQVMSGARGPRGWSYEYLCSLAETFKKLEIDDPELFALHDRIHDIVRVAD